MSGNNNQIISQVCNEYAGSDSSSFLEWPLFLDMFNNVITCSNPVAVVAARLVSDPAIVEASGFSIADKALEEALDKLSGIAMECFNSRSTVWFTRYSRSTFLVAAMGTNLSRSVNKFVSCLRELSNPFAYGTGFFPHSGVTPHAVITSALKAMDSCYQAHAVHHVGVENIQSAPTRYDLLEALKLKHIQVWHQPKVDLLTGNVIGHEALARWERGDHGIVMPGSFLPWFEFYGLSALFDEYIIRKVLMDVSNRSCSGGENISLAVNLSPAVLNKGILIPMINDFMTRHFLIPEMLEFEITERVVTSGNDAVAHQIHQLRECGFKVALDDFGTGWNNISTLSQLPLTSIKADRSLLIDAELRQDSRILNAIVSMAKVFGCGVVAEGIETQLQQTLALKAGCSVGQGFLYGRAEPSKLPPHQLAVAF